MVEAKTAYNYQQQYERYFGNAETWQIPERDRSVQERRKQRRVARGEAITVSRDRKIMLALIFAGILAMMFIIVMNAYAAKITYDINAAAAENDVIIGEIEDMKVELLASSNAGLIEQKAKSQLGMKTPKSSECVYVSAEDAPAEGFADVLKSKIYN